MQISKTDNVIFLKNVESNIIDQAFVILKENVKMNLNNCRNEESLTDINILKDAENLINYEIDRNNIKFEQFKCENLNKKIKILKIMNIVTVVLLVTSNLMR